jgi:hypothetical protein
MVSFKQKTKLTVQFRYSARSKNAVFPISNGSTSAVRILIQSVMTDFLGENSISTSFKLIFMQTSSEQS